MQMSIFDQPASPAPTTPARRTALRPRIGAGYPVSVAAIRAAIRRPAKARTQVLALVSAAGTRVRLYAPPFDQWLAQFAATDQLTLTMEDGHRPALLLTYPQGYARIVDAAWMPARIDLDRAPTHCVELR